MELRISDHVSSINFGQDMLEETNTYFHPLVVLVLLLVAIMVAYIALCAMAFSENVLALSQQLSALNHRSQMVVQRLDDIQQMIDKVSSEKSDLHALAAHFVPHRRTKQDVSDKYYYEEERSNGIGPEDDFYRELNGLG